MIPELDKVGSYIWISEGMCACEDGIPSWRAIGKVKLYGDNAAILVLNICRGCHRLMVDDGLTGMVALNPAVLEPAKPAAEKKEGASA